LPSVKTSVVIAVHRYQRKPKMKDYLVHADDHEVEYTETNFAQAKATARQLHWSQHKDVTIDQYEDEELTGVYWTYMDGKLVKFA
jgi:hypothetical protein